MAAIAFIFPIHALGAPELRQVQFSPNSDRIRILLELAEPAGFQASIDGRSNRIVVTFGVLAVGARASAGTGFGLVRIFHAEKAGLRTRLVFDLTRPAIIVSATLVRSNDGGPARAIVELAPSDAIAMKAASDRVYRAGFPATIPRTSASAPLSVAPAVPEIDARMAILSIPQAAAGVPPKRTVVVDPGHGGIDPGADSVAGYREKEITLATARVLQRTLEATGRYRVVLTRTADVYLRLRERVDCARKAHGDLFVSLHADSIGGPLLAVAERATRGASVYTLSETASDAESERYAQRENRADRIGGVNLRNQSDDVAGILVDLSMRETLNDENRFAGMLVESLEQGGVSLLPREPHRSAGFAVLKSPDIPSVLLEMGYLSDIGDARALASPQYQGRIAQAIAEAIDHYFSRSDTSRR